MKKAPKKSKKTAAVAGPEFRPYRVLFLVVFIAVTSLVLFAALGVISDY